MTDSKNEPVTNAGLRSDGELVQAGADRFDFRAPQDGETGDSDHRDWIDLMSVSQSASQAAPFAPEGPAFVYEAIERAHDDAQAVPLDDLL